MTKKFGPVVAGKFYPSGRDDLIDKIEDCYTHKFGPGQFPDGSEEELSSPVGLISPHAGYPYSGPVAAHAFRWLAEAGRPTVVVIIGTNHSGVGSSASLVAEGRWITPLGEVKFEAGLAREILKSSEHLEEDSASFSREHSIEVQLPFLQHIWGSEFSIVPICLKSQSKEVAGDVGAALEKNLPEGALIISSTDFTHYEPQEVAEEKDERAIKSIMDLEVEKFYRAVRKHEISICGYGSIGVLLNFALKKDLSPTKLKYATSGEVAGYGREVVGYGAIGFRK
ncbi:MAG: AmmeMemoRadiSam system protein B [Candidatus Bipolaricaulota bacterium]|nr:AmmeMemoRadiSam system protein B [Candidatus Bipolaricaulota bacterium]MBS3791959.1 AmmeMemoRadiSam system protein B [Candidatus Bipolaricaulota bacterium]